VATPRSVRSLSYWLLHYRHTWRGSVVTGLLLPILFLAAMGLKLGNLIQHSHGQVAGVSYLVFLAPGLLAANSMQVGMEESSWPVLSSVKWNRTYEAMLASPLTVVDVLVGHLGWIAIRLTIVCGLFLAVCPLFGALTSPGAALALPAAVLTGFAFATPIAAFAARQYNGTGFIYIYRFAIIPLFLFSGTFFPVSQLPAPVRPIAWLTPLWHGVQLCRSFALWQPDLADLGHAAYLIAMAALGCWLAVRAYRRRLAI
jgi:lipooligosaccharide transport system permease protein